MTCTIGTGIKSYKAPAGCLKVLRMRLVRGLSASALHGMERPRGEACLLADAEFLLRDDGAIAVDVLADQIVQKGAALSYQSLQGTFSGVVLMIGLHVLGKMGDAHREEGYLAFGAAGVLTVLTIFLEYVSFLFVGQMHDFERFNLF